MTVQDEGAARWPQSWTVRVTGLAFLLLCAETLFSVPYRTVYLAVHSPAKSWVAGLVGLLLAAAVFMRRHRLRTALLRSALPASLLSATATLAVGAALRLLWVLCFHPPLASDGAGYFTEATHLGLQHYFNGTFWPPGFPLFLSPFIALLGAHYFVAVLCGFLLFAATVLLARRVALQVTGSASAAAVAGWAVALWPGHIAIVGINSKEAWIAVLLTAVTGLLFGSRQGTGRRLWLEIVATGVLCGLAALTQPAFLLFPAVLLLAYWLCVRRLPAAVLRTCVAGCAMALTILPWTVRNYLDYHHVILVSSNGGSVFYRANNPQANASYSSAGEFALANDTVEADRQGYAMARAWITHHPVAFLVLSVRKQVVFLGDDGDGVYEGLKRNQSPNALLYAALKGVTSLYWFLLWLLLLCCLGPMLRSTLWPAWFGVAFLPYAYQWLIDSIFESGSRHHLAHVGCLAVLCAAAVVTLRNGERRAAFHRV